MIRFKKSKKIEQEQSKLEKRIASLETRDLTKWVDQTLFSIGKNVVSWERSGEIEMLLEADLGADALSVVIKELVRRSK